MTDMPSPAHCNGDRTDRWTKRGEVHVDSTVHHTTNSLAGLQRTIEMLVQGGLYVK